MLIISKKKTYKNAERKKDENGPHTKGENCCFEEKELEE